MANKEKIKISEKIDIIKLYHEDFVYRHTNYWGLVYKSMIAILGLLSLPYILYSTIYDAIILSLFPVLSLIISIFSIILLESEAVRMESSRNQINQLLNSLSDDFKEVPVDNLLKNNISLYRKLVKGKITKKVLFLYVLLIIISFVELYLIVSKTIFILPIITP